MEITVKELNNFINGKVEGDPEVLIEGFAPIDEATQGSITFLSNPKYHAHLYTTQASAVLLHKDFKPEKEVNPTLIYVEDVYSTLSSLMDEFNHPSDERKGIEANAYSASSSTLGQDVYVGANSYVDEHSQIGDHVKIYPNSFIGENCEIGAKTVIYPGVRIYNNTKIGQHCIIHSGVVIGSDGFGFAPQNNGTFKKMPQMGNVLIEDNVEIGANTTVDRATIRSTLIRQGVKLDNLIQVAHNVEIGENTAIASQTGISGSTKIGRNCVIGGQVGIVGHISIADGTHLGAQSGVSNSIKEPDQKWFGAPAAPIKDAKKSGVLLKKLPDLYDRIKKLEVLVKKLKSRLDEK